MGNELSTVAVIAVLLHTAPSTLYMSMIASNTIYPASHSNFVSVHH